jgi:4-diphosphocytidyl-2-C-methyl-D-erythritol kinase
MDDGFTAWPAPAKLNLFLHVVGRRPDGYHDLQTVFQLVDLTDTVRVRVRSDGRVERAGGWSGTAPEDDLALRAARLLKAETGCPHGADIHVDKRIPVGGGLGGGSSDAATVLLVLDRLWGLRLGQDRLADLGRRLGADVPVFVRGRSAWAEGTGDRLSAIPLPQRWFVILDPGVQVSTGSIFQASELTRNSPPTTIPRFLAGEGTRNDLEPVVRARHPRVRAALDWLAARAPGRLSGSGGCVFASFDARAPAEALAGSVPVEYPALVARGTDRSALHDALDALG